MAERGHVASRGIVASRGPGAPAGRAAPSGDAAPGHPRPSSAWQGVEPTDLPVVDGNGWSPMASEQPMHHYVEQLEGHLGRTAKRRPLRALPRRIARSLLGRPD